MKIANSIFLSSVFVLLPLAQEADAATKLECDVTVVGQASSPADVVALSDAVNGIHDSTVVTICLVGTFDFGESDRLVIDPVGNNPLLEELNIVGTGPEKAVFLGGDQAFSQPVTSTLRRLRIQDLRFVQPSVFAIGIFSGSELVEISGIEVQGVRPFVLPIFGVSIREGIFVNSNLTDDISGQVVIRDNFVDGGTYDPVLDLSGVNAGIAVLGRFGTGTGDFSAAVLIEGNTVRNWSGSAIAGLSLSGAEIADNTIEPGSFANKIQACALPTGFGAAAGLSLAGVSDSLVRNNTITLEQSFDGDSNTACTAGIILLGSTAGTNPALRNEFKGNKVFGTGSYAIIVGTELSTAEEENLFHDNSVHKFAPTGATLSLGDGANNNTFKGNFPSLEGNVAGNSITGY